MSELTTTKDWISNLRNDVGQFMEKLRVPGQAGHFRPTLVGTTAVGEKAALGFSCFGLKIFYTLGLWDELPANEQTAWLDFIRSYQILDESKEYHSSFIDTHLLEGITPPQAEGVRHRLRRWIKGEKKRNMVIEALRAETKQAIATLAQVGAVPSLPYHQFPQDRSALLKRLNEFPWKLPWLAGGQTAALSVFLQSQGPLISTVDEKMLVNQTVKFLDGLVDPYSGSYFRGKSPERGQLINGAMKILNALDWLEAPIHYPEKLIDTCLEQGPPQTGCHVVDWVYVVHRCLLQTEHRKADIQLECLNIVKMIKTHQNADLGFSYRPGKAQHNYYGATISKGFDAGDIHGTCLLLWALSMVADILEMDQLGWKVIRP
jgi:hypothetical protein